MKNKEAFKEKKHPHFMNGDWKKHKQTSRIVLGFFIIVVGVLVFLREIGLYIPSWLLSWRTFLIALGFFLLVKHNFKKIVGYILILIGVGSILRDISPDWVNTNLFWPVIIIGIGILVIGKSAVFDSKKKFDNDPEISFNDLDSEDFIQAEAFFGGLTKNIVSKNFRGGSLSQVFGGTKINLIQADFKNKAVIDLTCIFGGSTLIIPTEWKVTSEVTTVFGGLDDKRPLPVSAPETESKTLVLRGICLFGGVEINSYG